MGKAKKKDKAICLVDSTSMVRKNRDYISTMGMSMKEISLMVCLMGKVNWQLMKDNTQVILKMESNMEKGNLNGQMGLHIEVIIIKAFEKATESISIIKIQVYQEECGKKECWMEKENIFNLAGKLINVCGWMAKYQLSLINDIF